MITLCGSMKSKLLVFVCLLIVLVPSVVLGEDIITATTPAPFIPLVGIPGIPNPSTLQFGDYINSLYRLAISIAALLAVFKIVIAGAKYMLDDVVTHKQEAKEEIKGALIGLLIILGAVLILNTVNTDITKNIIAIDTLDTDSTDRITSLLTEAALKSMSDANDLCAAATEYETCQTDITTLTNQVDEPTCTAKGGVFMSGNWVLGSASNVTGIGDSTVRNRCTYMNFKDNIPDTQKMSCSCTDRRTSITWDSIEILYCYAYSCADQKTACETTSGGTVAATHEKTGELLCLLPDNPGVTSCPTGQIISVNLAGYRVCVVDPTPVVPLPAGASTSSIAYLCTSSTGIGCAFVGDFGWHKDTAYAQCDALDGDLQDDPAKLGYGICTY